MTTAKYHPAHIAANTPDRLAVINATTGNSISYGQLDQASRVIANLLKDNGLQAGDHVAIMVANHESFHAVVWGCLRIGMIVTPVSTHLRADEANYIIQDCEAKFLFIEEVIAAAHPVIGLDANGNRIAQRSVNAALAQSLSREHLPEVPSYPEEEGCMMLYSSGTTGFPKGIVEPWQRGSLGSILSIALLQEALFGFDQQTRFFTAAPLYHAAPLHWTLGAHRLGATVIIAEKFDAEKSLYAIDQFAVSHSVWVPTMFVRMLHLPDDIRARYSLASLKFVVHLAAPCAVAVKEKMLDWWGAIIHELYSGSEANGQCYISPEDWLQHKGSVGKPMFGSVAIYDEQGNSVANGTVGIVGFAGGRSFSYHKDEKKTQDSVLMDGITTLGDLGYLDQDGFLYLTGRKGQTIISGGVNVYPKEVENLLMKNTCIEDCFVFAMPDEEYGETVCAAIKIKPVDTTQETINAEEIIHWCKQHGSSIKAPKKIFFCHDIPRMETGKISKADQDRMVLSFMEESDKA